jgi:hypothetical protein
MPKLNRWCVSGVCLIHHRVSSWLSMLLLNFWLSTPVCLCVPLALSVLASSNSSTARASDVSEFELDGDLVSLAWHRIRGILCVWCTSLSVCSILCIVSIWTPPSHCLMHGHSVKGVVASLYPPRTSAQTWRFKTTGSTGSLSMGAPAMSNTVSSRPGSGLGPEIHPDRRRRFFSGSSTPESTLSLFCFRSIFLAGTKPERVVREL